MCEQFKKWAEEKEHTVKLVRLMDLNIRFCRACDYCMRNNGVCILRDNMPELLQLFQQADVLVLATPVYLYGISAQMKISIDRTYPIWQHPGKKQVYYIISAGLDKNIINRSLGILDAFVDHLEKYTITGRLHARNVIDAGLVKEQGIYQEAYGMGYSV